MSYLSELTKTLTRSKFFKDVATLMSGTAIAQMIGLLLMPIISRIYTPEDFGVFGSFIALTGIFSVGVTLQYQQALMLPPCEKDGFGLFLASVACALFFSLLITIAALFLNKLPFGAPVFISASWLPPALGMATFVNASYKSVLGWSTRKKAFRYNAVSRISRSLGVFSLQLSGGLLHLGSLGLIGGNTLGEAFSTFFLWKTVIAKDWSKYRKGFRTTDFLKLAWEYRDFPFFSTPQNILNAVSQGIPILLLGYYFGAGIAGAYAFGNRILQVPMNFILEALRQVLFQRASEASHRRENLFRIYYRATVGLFGFAVIPMILGFMFSPWLFSIVFGQSWYTAGEYARWLILWVGIMFCNAPSVIFARVIRKQKFLLFFSIVVLLARVVVLFIGGTFYGPLQTIILFSSTGGVLNLLLIFYVGSLIRKTH